MQNRSRSPFKTDMSSLALSDPSKDKLISQLRQELYNLKSNFADIDGLVEETNQYDTQSAQMRDEIVNKGREYKLLLDEDHQGIDILLDEAN